MDDPRALPTPRPWLTSIEAWASALRSADHTPQSVRTRVDHVRRFARAFPGGLDVDPRELVEWTGRFRWARETRRSVYASLKSFYSWAAREGLVGVSPAVGLPRVPASAPCPRPAPEDVYRAAVLGADARTALVLRLAGEAGLRRVEIARVHARDLVRDLAGWSLLVHGKGRRERWVPLSDEVAGLVRAATSGGGWALPGSDEGHLSARYVGTLAGRALPAGWTAHTLRHRFATVAFAGTRDLLAVQQLLGHASPATTQRYVRPPADAARRAMLAAA